MPPGWPHRSRGQDAVFGHLVAGDGAVVQVRPRCKEFAGPGCAVGGNDGFFAGKRFKQYIGNPSTYELSTKQLLRFTYLYGLLSKPVNMTCCVRPRSSTFLSRSSFWAPDPTRISFTGRCLMMKKRRAGYPGSFLSGSRPRK